MDKIAQDIPFFATLSKEEQKSLLPLLQKEVLSENQILFQKGDFGNKMYFIKSGKIKIYDTPTNFTGKIVGAFSVNKKEKEINTLSAGDFFGEMALISNEPRLFFAKSIKNTTLYSINREDLKKLLSSNFEAEKVIAKTFVERVVRNNQ